MADLVGLRAITMQQPFAAAMAAGIGLFTRRGKPIAFAPGAATVIGTPDDLVAAVRRLIPLTGGFGTLIGFVHDWANRENTSRSWDMVARYVVPELNGMLDNYRESKDFVINHRDAFEAAGKAVMNKILEHEGATAALAKTKDSRLAMPGHNAPDLLRKN
jgi:limonene 1,2-monooxygenase